MNNIKVELLKDLNGKKVIFRGQSENLPLLANVGRGVTNRIDEEAMLGEFKRFGLLHFQGNPRKEISKPKNDFEWLVLAQHYGMKTRFLDWSQKFEVALFFAVSDAIYKDGVVWAYVLPGNDSSQWLSLGHRDILEKSPFDFTELKIYHPKTFLDYRSDNQYSVLTLHSSPKTPLEGESEYRDHLKSVVIDSARKQELLKELDSKSGVNYSYLFGGIEGIGRYLNHKFLIN